jgi:predicted metal-binding membrane protein
MSSFLVGVLWITTGIVQILPSTMRALHSCRSLGATDNAGIAGLRQGVWCLQACWLLMVATIVTASALPQVPAIGVMIIATVLMLAEKSRHTSPKMVRALGIAFIAVGALTIVVAPGLHVHV